jgi:competence protein ComEA
MVPFVNQPAAPPQATPIGSSPPQTTASGRINVNTATVEQLDTLPGIGPALAGRIVSYRQQHGSFASIEELSNVSGISPKMVEALRDKITVGP